MLKQSRLRIKELDAGLDSFVNKINQTKEATKLQGEELFTEDTQFKETVDTTFTINRDKIIKKEKVIKTCSSAKSKFQEVIKDLDNY